MTWNLAEAKNRLTEVVNLALTEGPQTITRRNDTVVLVSAEKYAELTGQKLDFKEFLFRGVGLRRTGFDPRPKPEPGCRTMKGLLDTCVVAEIGKHDGNPAVKSAVAEIPDGGPLPERPHRGRDRQGHRPPRGRQEEEGPGLLARRARNPVRRPHPRR